MNTFHLKILYTMSKIRTLLGEKADYYLYHTCKTIDKSLIHAPGSDTVARLWMDCDRNTRVLGAVARKYAHKITLA